MRARAAAFLFSLALLGLTSCADGDLFNPNRNPSTQLSFRPYLAVNASASAMVDVNQVRVTVHRLPGGDVVAQEVVPVDPAATTYDLNVDVPANSDLRILIELLNTVGGVTTVQFSGVIEMSVSSGPQAAPPADIPVFPGGPENLGITGVTIAPRERAISEGETFRFTPTVTGGPANPAVLWVSLNSAVATVAADGTVTGVGPGSTIITAFAGRMSDAVRIDVGPRAASVQITPASPGTIGIGSQVTFTGRVIGSNGQVLPGLAITWSAADPSVATQVSPGVFRGLRAGTTQITATATQGARVVTGSVSLSVEQRPLTVIVSPGNAFIRAIGETASFTATARDADNTEIGGLPVTWSTSDPAIASVDAQGVVTAHRNGTVRVRATILTFTGEAEVVISQTATSLIVTPSEHTLESLGESVQLEAQLEDAFGNPVDARVEWSTSNAEAATVTETGLVTATGDGFAVITAQVTGAQGSATIFITRVVAGIELTPAEFQVNTGGTFTLQAMAVDANEHLIPDVPLTWTSSDDTIATVDANGVVTGVRTGIADITARAGDVTATARANVTGEYVPGAPFNLLIVSNSSGDNTNIRNQLLELMPHVTVTTTTNESELTPSYLSQFRVVLLFENGLWNGAPSAGNAIANYVQSGGNVVIGTFYWQDRSGNPQYPTNYGWGALEALDMFHAPPGMSRSEFSSKFEYRSATLDPSSIVPHPLTEGVATLSVGSYPNGMDAKPGTTVVASYANGAPLIGYVTHGLGQRLVGIAVWPAHERNGGISGDFWRIWTNALDWAAAGGTPSAPPLTMRAPAINTIPQDASTPKVGGSNGIR